MATFEIIAATDSFQFIDFSGVGQIAANQVSVHSTPGVNGYELWLTGVRGEPFEVMSFVDALDYDDAVWMVDRYRAIRGQQAYLILNGIPYNWAFDVLNVVPIDDGVRATELGVGGVLGESYAEVSAVWTLMQVYENE